MTCRITKALLRRFEFVLLQLRQATQALTIVIFNRERDGEEALDLVEVKTVDMDTSTPPPHPVLSKVGRLLFTSASLRSVSVILSKYFDGIDKIYIIHNRNCASFSFF